MSCRDQWFYSRLCSGWSCFAGYSTHYNVYFAHHHHHHPTKHFSRLIRSSHLSYTTVSMTISLAYVFTGLFLLWEIVNIIISAVFVNQNYCNTTNDHPSVCQAWTIIQCLPLIALIVSGTIFLYLVPTQTEKQQSRLIQVDCAKPIWKCLQMVWCGALLVVYIAALLWGAIFIGKHWNPNTLCQNDHVRRWLLYILAMHGGIFIIAASGVVWILSPCYKDSWDD